MKDVAERISVIKKQESTDRGTNDETDRRRLVSREGSRYSKVENFWILYKVALSFGHEA